MRLGERNTRRRGDGRLSVHLRNGLIEQRLDQDRGVKLLSGAYAVRTVDAAHTDLSITTVYSTRLGPRWLMQWLETMICRRLQHHLLAEIGKRALQN